MTLARRMGLWALLFATAWGGRMLWVALRPAPSTAVRVACAAPVEVRGPTGSTVGCATDAALAQAHPLRAGDAVVLGPPVQVLPGGMGDAMRLALGLPLDVNRASAACLGLVPGLSPRVALEVVEDRERHGPFASLEALRRVRGVGPATLRRAGAHLYVDGGPPWPTTEAFAIPRHVKREWLVDVVARLPQGSVSRAWGWLARQERPRVAVTAFKKVFANAVGINLDDASQQDMGAYPSLEALFVRRLRPGARPIDGDADAVVSPVDALVGATGIVDNGTLLQIKGRSYSLARLLGDEAEAARFEGGAFATLYLAPRDYHRIHAPVGGQVSQARLIVGSLMPVFEESLNKVDELFARNERIITYMDTPRHGRVAVVKVGATLVGRIKVAYDETLVGNKRHGKNRLVTYKMPKLIAKGGDLGAFELGSTVVLLAEPGQMDLTPLKFGERVFVGRRIGTLKKSAIKGSKAPQG